MSKERIEELINTGDCSVPGGTVEQKQQDSFAQGQLLKLS